MKNLFIVACLLNLLSFGNKLAQAYYYENDAISQISSDPSVSIYLVDSKDFKGNRGPAIVSNR